MAEAHRRVKNPIEVRERLIEAARELALEQGLAAVTTAAVSTKAGVTKGGLFHHFAHKQALVDAVFDHMIEELEAKLDGLMAVDGSHSARFTRAYVEAAFDADESRWGPIWMTTLTDPGLRTRWTDWYDGMVERHEEQDARLIVARLAADGAWLANLAGSPPQDPEGLKRLILSISGAGD